MYYKDNSKSYYKKEYHSKSANNYSNDSSRTTNNSKYQNSKYEPAPRKSFERKEYSNNSSNHYSKEHKPKYDKQESTSRKYKSEANNPSHNKQSWNPEQDGEKRSERSFLDFIGIETNENIIAKRQFQIDAAKASFAYARYSMLVAKNQRITDMPQTPNKFMRTNTISWMQTVKKWVKQLRGWQIPGGPSLPSPVWIPEEKTKPIKSTTQPARGYESDSSQDKYRSKREYHEKKIERKRKRSLTPSPPRTRTFTHNTQLPHAKYPRTSTHDTNTKYPSRGYTKKIHYEAFSNSEDFANNSPKLERKVSYVKDCGPRFTHSSRDDKQDLRYKMRQPHTRNNLTTRKFEYRNESDRRSYTNISWSPDNSPIRQSHYSPYNRHGNMGSLPRERQTSPITPPLLHKELTPEFDIPGQQWEMENELVLLEDV